MNLHDVSDYNRRRSIAAHLLVYQDTKTLMALNLLECICKLVSVLKQFSSLVAVKADVQIVKMVWKEVVNFPRNIQI